MANRTVAVNFTANTAPYVAGVRGATAATAQFGKRVGASTALTAGLNNAGLGMAARFLGPAGVVVALKWAADAAIDFESAALKMQTLVGLTAEETDELANAARRVGVEFGVGSQKAVEAAFFIASAGLRGKNATDALERSAVASALGLGEMATVADLLTSAMNAYGPETLTAARATDILLAGVREGKFEASALAGALGSVLPTASAMNISFEEVVGTLAVWSRTGGDVASGVTSLQAIMSTLMGTSQEGKDLLEDYGLSLADLRDMAAGEGGLLQVMRLLDDTFGDNMESLRKIIPNQRAFRGVMATLAQEAKIVDGVMTNVAGSTGMADEAIRKALSENTRNKIDRMKASFGDLRIEIGTELSPAVGALADAMFALSGAALDADDSMSGAAVSGAILLDVFKRGEIGSAIERLGVYLGVMNYENAQFAESAPLTADQFEKVAAANRLFNGMVRDSVDLLPQVPGLLDDVADSTGEVTEAQSPLARALDISNRALEAQIRAATGLYEAHLASVDPLYAAVRAQRDYERALQDLVDLEDEGKQGSIEYAEAVLGAELAFWRLQAANGEAGVASEAWIGVLNEAIATNRITTEEARFLIDALNDTGIAMLELDGTTIRTKHIHEVVYRAGENLEFIGGAWVPKGSIPYMARGGPVSAGQPYIVGEEGPELIVPNTSGTVMTANQTSSILGGGGGGSGVGGWTVNVHMPPGADGEQVVAALRRWERANGPVPVGVR
jgi:TP901 family phage tail tape measure protein